MKDLFKTIFITCYFSFLFSSCGINAPKAEAITPPLDKVEIKEQAFKIDPTKAQSLKTKEGTVLDIPKDAFVNAKGEVVTGKVEVKYKSFSSTAEILASGIPMTHQDENGEVQNLESAGMFEIEGFADGEPVFVGKDKSINVHYNSDKEGVFDFFYLEPEGEKSYDQGNLFLQTGTSNVTTDKKYTWKKLTNNVPEKVEESSFDVVGTFDLAFDTANYPETKLLKDINWKLATDDVLKDPNQTPNNWLDTMKWETVHISQPNYEWEEVKRFENELERLGWFNYHLVAPYDSSSVIVSSNNTLAKYGWDGEKKEGVEGFAFKTFGNPVKFLLDEKLMVTKDTSNVVAVYDKDWKEVINLGRTNHLEINEKVNVFLQTPWTEERDEIKIYDFAGKLLKTVTFKDRKSNTSIHPKISPDSIFFMVNYDNKIKIYDVKGTLIKEKVYDQKYVHAYFSGYQNNIVLSFGVHTTENKLWDWEKDIEYTIPVDYEDKKGHSYHGTTVFHHQLPIALVSTFEGEVTVYNWKTKEEKKLSGYVNYLRFSEKQNLIMGRNKLFNLKGELLSDDSFYRGNSYYGYQKIANDEKSFLTRKDGMYVLMDAKGEVIYELVTINESIKSDINIKGENIIWYSTKGNIKIWDINTGQLKNEFNVGTQKGQGYFMRNQDWILWYDDFAKQAYVYDYNGNLLLSLGKKFGFGINKEKDRIFIGDGKENSIVKFDKEVTKNSYQLIVRSGKAKKSFTTFIYLTNKEKKTIDLYNSAIKKRQLQELKRQKTEQKVLRSFAIKKFGIYNWDRYYKQESNVTCEANFTFDASTSYTDVTVFLVSQGDANSVIKYPKYSWDKFSFNPEQFNKLLAILPDNEVALFTEQDFSALDLEKIKTSGKHTFKLKTVGKIESMKDLDKLLSPSL